MVVFQLDLGDTHRYDGFKLEFGGCFWPWSLPICSFSMADVMIPMIQDVFRKEALVINHLLQNLVGSLKFFIDVNLDDVFLLPVFSRTYCCHSFPINGGHFAFLLSFNNKSITGSYLSTEGCTSHNLVLPIHILSFQLHNVLCSSIRTLILNP